MSDHPDDLTSDDRALAMSFALSWFSRETYLDGVSRAVRAATSFNNISLEFFTVFDYDRISRSPILESQASSKNEF